VIDKLTTVSARRGFGIILCGVYVYPGIGVLIPRRVFGADPWRVLGLELEGDDMRIKRTQWVEEFF
jgi:hypothetical protein